MSKLIDLTGRKIGKLTVIDRAEDYVSPNGVRAVKWNCRCDCGNIVQAKTMYLTRGKITSCGCDKIDDLISQSVGKRYGKLTCLEYSHAEHGNGYFFKFKCDCGNIKIFNLSRVRNGYIKSCGCLRKENSRKAVFKDLTGQKFNHLTVIEYIGQRKGRTMWRCQCDCGNEIEVDSSSLKSGNTTACGCRQSIGWGNGKTHGKIRTRIYRIWRGMKDRCTNPNNPYYKNYGGRGITVCKEWKDNFQAFYDWAIANGYADDLTIDRIENNGNYEPSNCRWVDRFEQMSNTRSNRNIEYKGKTQTLAQWARELNFPYYILDGRINNYGWSVEKAFETPIQKRGGNHKINCMQ